MLQRESLSPVGRIVAPARRVLVRIHPDRPINRLNPTTRLLCHREFSDVSLAPRVVGETPRSDIFPMILYNHG
jgi:hypothetical protein